MNNIIKINAADIGGSGVQTVNARELHAFMESKRQFANWIAERIEQYGFVEGVDFTVNKFVNGKATQTDYHLTLDMAKELAMVERNEKGKQARQYFIECEKQLKENRQDWRRLRHAAASSYKLMSEVLMLTRDAIGKKSAPHHFMNEARLINLALTGEFKGLNRDGLSDFEMDVLGKLEIRNTALIAMGLDYQERKSKILAYMESFKIAYPGKLQLGGA